MKNIIFYLMAAVVLLMTACENQQYEKSEITSITLTKSTVMLQIGETASVGIVIEPAGALSDVVWSTADAKIATVDQLGGIKAIAKGTTSIIVTTVTGKKTASCAVYVNPVRVARIELDKAALYMLPGDSAKITAKVYSANPPVAPTDTVVLWTSSDPKVVSVSPTGNVKATGFGNATITATTEDGGLKATCLVVVSKVSVTGIMLKESSIQGTFGDSIKLTASVLPDNATFPEIIWTSSDEKMVTVSKTGVVKFVNKNAGTAVIRATSADNENFWAECNVTILKDMSGYIETTLWEGNTALGNWSGSIALDASKFANVNVGDSIKVYVTGQDASATYWQFILKTWAWADIPGFTANLSKTATSYTFAVTQALLDQMKAGLRIQGYMVTVTKVTIISKAPVGEVIWEGNVALGNWSGSIQLPASKFANTKVGQTILVNVADQVSTATYWQFILKTSGWTDIPGFKAELAIDAKSKEFTITQALLDEMKKGLIIQGYMVSVTKVTIMP